MLACDRPRGEVFGHQKLESAEPPVVDATDPPESALAYVQGDHSPHRAARLEPRSTASGGERTTRHTAPPQSTQGSCQLVIMRTKHW